jgi:signal peptide peptidase SppA
MARNILGQFFSDALAMHQPALQELMSKVSGHRATDSGDNRKQDANELLPNVNDLVVDEVNGVAVVPIHGVMVKRTKVFAGWYDTVVVTGVDHWATMISRLAERADIRTIVIDADTGGGQVAGTANLADAIWKARQKKPVIGVVNEFAASAGLWALSQCSEIVTTPTAGIGSLGVYMLHFDDTKFLSEIGFDKSVVYRGTYKAIHERPLDKALRADMQRFVDGTYSQFVDAVARGRGVSSEQVMEQWGESQLFTGNEAVSTGLADTFGTLQDVLDSLQAGRSGQVLVTVDPVDQSEKEPLAMKLNAEGQVLDASGKVVGKLSELGLNASVLATHCKDVVDEMIASAVKTAKASVEETAKAEADGKAKADAEKLSNLIAAVGAEKGAAAFLSGKTVEQAKADLADTLKAEVETLKADLAKAQRVAPGFSASDKSEPLGKAADVAEKDAPFAADWNANADKCQDTFPNLSTYASYRRHAVR